MSLDLLVNRGIATINLPARHPDQKTIVVVGVARGGTSIVAGALHHLGMYMGSKYHAPVFEDMRLSLAFEGKSKESFKQVIEDYNQHHPVWGWKRPSSLHDLPRVASAVRNPFFIFVFRDLFSIANRNAISMKMKIEIDLRRALDEYGKIIRFIENNRAPAMLVSSDKATRNREDLLEGLCLFTGLQPNPKQYEMASAFISPEPTAYLDATRITKSRGDVNIDLLQTGLLRGWARAVHHSNPVQVEIRTKNGLIATVTADIYREHLDRPDIHPTGICGFEIDLKTLGVKPDAEIMVRVKDDVVDLHKEPISFKQRKRWMTKREWRLAREKKRRK